MSLANPRFSTNIQMWDERKRNNSSRGKILKSTNRCGALNFHWFVSQSKLMFSKWKLKTYLLEKKHKYNLLGANIAYSI